MFLLDVHIPESIAEMLQAKGYEVERGAVLFPPRTSDEQIAKHAKKRGQFVISCDRGFGDILRFPPASYPGFIVLRPYTQGIRALCDLFAEFLAVLDVEACRGKVTVVEPGRIRRYPASGSE